MNRIVLIGNGFDLAHGLKTSYKNFIDWYWKDWGEKLLHGLNKTETDGLCSFMIKDNVEVLNWASVFQGWYYRRENPLIPWNVNDVIHLVKENKDIYTDSSFKENYGWQLENVEVFDEPIEAKGKLSLWEYEMK